MTDPKACERLAQFICDITDNDPDWSPESLAVVIFAAYPQIAETPPATGRRVQHVKRGSFYRVVTLSARLQSSKPIAEGAELVVYQAEADGAYWARPRFEFEDGRFVSAPTQTEAPPSGNEAVEAAQLLVKPGRAFAERGTTKAAMTCARYILSLAPSKDAQEVATEIVRQMVRSWPRLSGDAWDDFRKETIAAIATAITAAARERDEARRELEQWQDMADYNQSALAAAQKRADEAAKSIERLTEELRVSNADADHFNRLAFVDVGANPPVAWKTEAERLTREMDEARQELERLSNLINTPHVNDFLENVRTEAAHQIERWGVEHDAGKTDADWFWLIGYLAGKAINKPEKKLHHIITTAAACLNWHRQAIGVQTKMRPGIDPKERGINDAA